MFLVLPIADSIIGCSWCLAPAFRASLIFIRHVFLMLFRLMLLRSTGECNLINACTYVFMYFITHPFRSMGPRNAAEVQDHFQKTWKCIDGNMNNSNKREFLMYVLGQFKTRQI